MSTASAPASLSEETTHLSRADTIWFGFDGTNDWMWRRDTLYWLLDVCLRVSSFCPFSHYSMSRRTFLLRSTLFGLSMSDLSLSMIG